MVIRPNKHERLINIKWWKILCECLITWKIYFKKSKICFKKRKICFKKRKRCFKKRKLFSKNV